MRVLLAVVCLVAVFSQYQAFEMSPGAESGTFLNEVQTEMIEIYRWLYPDGQSLNSKANLAVMVAKADLCKINDKQYQNDSSIFLGTACKIELVKLYNDDPEQCSALFCDVTTNAETFLLEILSALIAADTDDKFFHIIVEQFIDPIMQYNCRCLIKLLGAWMDCKHNISEADVWNLLLNLGEYDTSAEYLGGQEWKDFWVDVVVERIPWGSIKTLFDRTMTHLCQKNTDKKGIAKCYTYFHKAFIKLYKVFLKATGKKPAVKENATLGDDDTPSHCTTFSRSFFGDTRKTIVAKFCVEDCVPFYQRAFFGCCTASMNEDKALKRAAVKTTKRLTKIVEDLLIGMEWEEVFQFDIISIIFREFQGVLKMLRTPTCKESYDMTPCTGESQLNEEEERADNRRYQALKFGSSLPDYIIYRPDMTPLQDAFSVCSWIRKLRSYGHPTWLSYAVSGSDLYNEIMVSDDGQWIYIFDGHQTLTSHFSGAYGNWYHYCQTWSLSSRTRRVYINGRWISSFATQAGRRLRLNGYLMFGNDQDGLGTGLETKQIFGGELYKLNFFSKELSSSEVWAMARDKCSGVEETYGDVRSIRWEDILLKERNGDVTEIESGCTALGWIQVDDSGYINQNMDNSPFKIKTLSGVGSNERVVLNFYTNDTVSAGGLRIVFSDPPQYQLHECTNFKNFLRDLPASDEKIWNIKVKKNKGIKVLIYCNKELMVQIKLSDETCNYNGSWSEKWGGSMRKVRFTSEDTASKFYKPSREN